MPILVDTNVIIDVLTDDPDWASWSQSKLDLHESEELSINPAIFAELCFGCDSLAEAEMIMRQFGFSYLETTREGLFRAAKAFAKYKRSGGPRDFLLPDFFVGGHAEASSFRILTRDETRYRAYFPSVELLCP